MSVWRDAVVAITGGTGTLGSALTGFVLGPEVGAAAVRVVSRDEYKQARMSARLRDDRVRYLLGDVRDRERMRLALRGADVVVHAAALKRVDSRYDPFETVQTNVVGTRNVVLAAIEGGAGRVVGVSTDKGCAPASVYGATKLLLEHLMAQGNVYAGRGRTRCVSVRYGNVLGSRGSAVPLWLDQAARGGPLTLTDDRMTRFWITVQRACRLIVWAADHAGAGEVVIPDLPRSRVADMAEACWLAAAPRDAKSPPAVTLVGERPGGEKLHECLLSEDEGRIARGWVALPCSLPGVLVRHGGAATGEAFAPLHSNTPPLLDVTGCLALLRAAGLVATG